MHNFDKLSWEIDSLLNLDIDNYIDKEFGGGNANE